MANTDKGDNQGQTNQPNTDNDNAGNAAVGDPNGSNEANDFTANENALGGDPNNRPEGQTDGRTDGQA